MAGSHVDLCMDADRELRRLSKGRARFSIELGRDSRFTVKIGEYVSGSFERTTAPSLEEAVRWVIERLGTPASDGDS